MTWKSFHHRGDVLRAVIAAASDRRDAMLPMDVDGVRETFGDELTLLAALQLKWHTRLSGHIEQALLAQPMHLDDAVIMAWCETADELPGLRLILDHYRSAPVDDQMAIAMLKATRKEHLLLAVMAGLASVGDSAGVPLGAALEERARSAHRGAAMLLDATDSESAVGERPSLLDRLKAVVAA